MISLDAHVGGRVRTLRIARGKTDAAFAKQLGCSTVVLALKESGQARFSVRDLEKVCRSLEVRPADFYEGHPLMIG